MLTATPVHPEGPRYAAPIVYLAGLWVSPVVWRPVATYLAHRGWEGRLLDTRGVRGGIAARADAVAADLAKRAVEPVLVGHDAGAMVALAVAAKVPVRALVLAAPLVPGRRERTPSPGPARSSGHCSAGDRSACRTAGRARCI